MMFVVNGLVGQVSVKQTASQQGACRTNACFGLAHYELSM